MPRRNLLTPAERTGLLAFPTTDDEIIQHYTFSEPDLSVIRQRRGSHNRLGFAVQLCYLRYPGFTLPTDAEPPASLLNIVGRQLRIEPDIWPQYADYRHFVHQLAEVLSRPTGVSCWPKRWSSFCGSNASSFRPSMSSSACAARR